MRLPGLAADFTTAMVDSCFAMWPMGGSLLRGVVSGGGSLVVGGGGWPHGLWDFFFFGCCWIVYKPLDFCCCGLFWVCFQIYVVVVVVVVVLHI